MSLSHYEQSWPVRFRRPAASDGSVLVPDVPGLATAARPKSPG